jgi:hypothetical protein
MLAPAVILVPFSRCLSRRFSDQVDLLPPPVEVRGFELSAAWHPRLQADPAREWLPATVRRRRTAHDRAGTKDPVKARNVKNIGLELRVIWIGEEPTFESKATFADGEQLRSPGMGQRPSAQDTVPVPQSLYVG